MRPVRQVLNSEPALADWLARRDAQQRLATEVRALLPPTLAARVFVADARLPDLVLGVSSGAFAALLRQKGPAILEKLSSGGWEFTSIRVRVQVASNGVNPTQLPIKHIDSAAAATLAAMAERAGPGRLQDALRRLSAVAAGAVKE